MEITVIHLYPESMNLYGEYANLAVLRRHLEAIGVTVQSRSATFEDVPDFNGADLVYMGAGTERRQKAVLENLAPHASSLREAVDRGAALLFTGNAMELLGTSITDAGGKVWQGLGLAEFASEETGKRCTGDVIASPALWDSPAVGYMNKCSVTHGVETPLFTALPMGFGNEAEHGAEGYVSGDLFATHITGPILVKNPEFIDLLIRRLFARKGWEPPRDLPAFPFEREAYQVTYGELQARNGK